MTTIQQTALADVSVLRRLIDDVWHGGDLDVIDALYDERYVGHDPAKPVPLSGPEGVRDRVGAARAAFPDIRFEVRDIVVSGDRLAYRYVARATHTGALARLASTGRRVTVNGLEIMRFGLGGKVDEQWSCWDVLGLLRQLGVLELDGGDRR